jgi:hypothetical protein
MQLSPEVYVLDDEEIQIDNETSLDGESQNILAETENDKESSYKFSSINEVTATLNLDSAWQKIASSTGTDVLKKDGTDWLYKNEAGEKKSLTEEIKDESLKERFGEILKGLNEEGFAIAEFKKNDADNILVREVYFADEKGNISYEIFNLKLEQENTLYNFVDPTETDDSDIFLSYLAHKKTSLTTSENVLKHKAAIKKNTVLNSSDSFWDKLFQPKPESEDGVEAPADIFDLFTANSSKQLAEPIQKAENNTEISLEDLFTFQTDDGHVKTQHQEPARAVVEAQQVTIVKNLYAEPATNKTESHGLKEPSIISILRNTGSGNGGSEPGKALSDSGKDGLIEARPYIKNLDEPEALNILGETEPAEEPADYKNNTPEKDDSFVGMVIDPLKASSKQEKESLKQDLIKVFKMTGHSIAPQPDLGITKEAVYDSSVAAELVFTEQKMETANNIQEEVRGVNEYIEAPTQETLVITQTPQNKQVDRVITIQKVRNQADARTKEPQIDINSAVLEPAVINTQDIKDTEVKVSNLLTPEQQDAQLLPLETAKEDFNEINAPVSPLYIDKPVIELGIEPITVEEQIQQPLASLVKTEPVKQELKASTQHTLMSQEMARPAITQKEIVKTLLKPVPPTAIRTFRQEQRQSAAQRQDSAENTREAISALQSLTKNAEVFRVNNNRQEVRATAPRNEKTPITHAKPQRPTVKPKETPREEDQEQITNTRQDIIKEITRLTKMRAINSSQAEAPGSQKRTLAELSQARITEPPQTSYRPMQKNTRTQKSRTLENSRQTLRTAQNIIQISGDTQSTQPNQSQTPIIRLAA